MKSRFTLVALLALGLGFTACEDAFNEKDAIEAQKELLTLKYQNEAELEKLRISAATALKQLEYTNLIAQIKFEDSLAKANAKEASRQAYTLTVKDVATGSPLSGATVSVISEGGAVTAETNELGIAIFENLLIYLGSQFQVTKEGYAATLVSATSSNYYYSSPLEVSYNVSLWNTANANNEVKGTAYIETDLTNSVTEKVPAGTLVTASVVVPESGHIPAYKVQFPTTTDASGNYSIKLPDVPEGYSYTLTFGQVAADQKLYLNYTQDDVNKEFPNALPRVATMRTYFNLNNSSAGYPSDVPSYYFVLEGDTMGRVAYAKQNFDWWGENYMWVSGSNGSYELEGVRIEWLQVKEGVDKLEFKKNDTLSLAVVDYAGQYVTTAPKLVAYTDGFGDLIFNGGSLLVEFAKKDGVEVTGARGKFKKDPAYSLSNNTEYLEQLSYSTSISGVKGGSTIVRSYTYSTGASREKIVE
jgi:hypothetical protein